MKLASWLPVARWLHEYRAAWLSGDLVAGMTLAAYAISVSLAYPTLGRIVFPPVLADAFWVDLAAGFPEPKYLGVREMQFY